MTYKSSPAAAENSVRLQKAMADAGVAARRECEGFIREGRVRVNGSVVTTLPCFIDPARDKVDFDGDVVKLVASATRVSSTAPAAARSVYVLLNKPKGVITTTRDDLGRRSVLDLLPRSLQAQRLFPVGRLDADSTGLLLLTNDGELAFRLTHPKFGITKQYRVVVSGLASGEQITQLRRGMFLPPGTRDGSSGKRATMESIRVVKRMVDRNLGDRSLLAITLREGQNREIRRMLARVGLKVRSLERIAIGPLRPNDLPLGETRLLGKQDVARLRAAVEEPS
jgi:pseudouridine synthase